MVIPYTFMKRTFKDIDKNLNHKFKIWKRDIELEYSSPFTAFKQFYNYLLVLEDIGTILNTEEYDKKIDEMYSLYYGCNKDRVMEIILKHSKNSMLEQLNRAGKIIEMTDFENEVYLKWQKIINLEKIEL